MKELTSGDILLRALADSDKERLAELCNNKKILDNLRDNIPFPYTVTDAELFIQHCKTENPPVTFAIEYRNELAGVIGLVKQSDVYKHSAEIGYWLGEQFWGKGIATEAVKLIVEYGFLELKLVRIFTGVFDYNTASQKVLRKAGFILEGIFDKSVIKNGTIYDEYRYAKINQVFD
jgi:ribosomal-protein-alanine N-acetyltransferase